ncbi:HAD-IB family hydrolase [Brevundimonas sp. 2R-24]|uniref:HAD-IB family hydrolase n=1 Tax=Peiella sedimenti TaxID=3061083 RepID=A0ABT8SJQ9_9CAUL|nr:HAD-IB family hydrolase [Caulobacteraceae bacterium XZ-24]
MTAQRHDPRPIVAFDFDGTLTVADSFTNFLKDRLGVVWPLRWSRLAPDAFAYAFHRDRGRIKAAAVNAFLRGMERRRLEEAAEAFCDKVWDRFMRPDALACWNDWRSKGARLIIVTASPDLTVGPFARRLGADDLLGTQLAFDARDRVTGAFACDNCRGPEKVRRLEALLGPDFDLEAAYGDTSGDTEMLERARTPGYRLFTARP